MCDNKNLSYAAYWLSWSHSLKCKILSNTFPQLFPTKYITIDNIKLSLEITELVLTKMKLEDV